MRAVRADKEVIEFLNNCGNQNLQYLLVPSRLEAALLVLNIYTPLDRFLQKPSTKTEAFDE